jgi:hypothetical protein
MAVRTCPHCGTEIPALMAAARSNGLECPKCGALLEVAPGARTISSFAGLLAGLIAWELSRNSDGILGGVLPTLYAFLAFGVVSPLVLMLAANFRNAPAEPAALEPPHYGGPTSSPGHASTH